MIRKRPLFRCITGSALAVLALGLLVAAVPAAASGGGTVGTLQVNARLDTTWRTVACPAGTTSPPALCYATQGHGVVPGLGRTSEQYTYVIDDDSGQTTSEHFTAVIAVAGKGEIDASAKTPSPVCSCFSAPVSFEFTITGGTGAYAGAQGSGTVLDVQRSNGLGKDTWSGTLTVPGYTFDTTLPVISGAVPRAVKAPTGAKHMRVTYKVTARDADEGSLPVTCTPRSGSLFKLGRTIVRCTATDANGNSAKKSFTVTVKRATS